MSHMILAASMAEPPPTAMMVSGSKAASWRTPSCALCSLGSGSTSQNELWTMPILSSCSSMDLVKPLLYRNWSVTMKARFLPIVPSSPRASDMQPFLK